MVKVSVIIPVYNTEKYLEKCLDSVCAQTLKDIEIICINDCSTDNSLDILKKRAEQDERIKIINLAENKGAGFSRNIGIKEAIGEYVGFIDSDDFIDLNFYEVLFQRTNEINCDVIKGNIKTYNIATNQANTEDWLNLNNSILQNPAYFTHTFTSAIYKRTFILKNELHFIEDIIHFEDPFFTISAMLCTDKIQVENNVFYYYCNNPNSASRKNHTINHARGISKGARLIIDKLNSAKISCEHYKICSSFVLNQVICWCNMQGVSNDIIGEAVEGLAYVLSNLKYQNESLLKYFLDKKNTIINRLRDRIKNNKQGYQNVLQRSCNNA